MATTTRKTAARKPAARKSAAKGKAQTRTAAKAEPSPVERAAYLQVGAALAVRDTLVEAVTELRELGDRQAAGRELHKLERRGRTASNRVERKVRQRRNQVERELKRNRTRVERELRMRRREAEKQAKVVRKDAARWAEDVTASVQEAVGPVVERIQKVAA